MVIEKFLYGGCIIKNNGRVFVLKALPQYYKKIINLTLFYVLTNQNITK